jgi:hypothetical protein
MTGSLLRPLDALRAGSAWAQDWIFVLADKVTPAGGWDDRTAAVYLVPKSPTLRAIAANLVAFTGDEVVVTADQSRVAVRGAAARTDPIAAGMYGIEVKRLGGPDGPESVFIGEIPIRQSLAEIVDGEDCTDGLNLAGDSVGTIIVVPALGAAYGTGVGAMGYSAYQIAVQEGFEGSVSEWLASLAAPATEAAGEAYAARDAANAAAGAANAAATAATAAADRADEAAAGVDEAVSEAQTAADAANAATAGLDAALADAADPGTPTYATLTTPTGGFALLPADPDRLYVTIENTTGSPLLVNEAGLALTGLGDPGQTLPAAAVADTYVKGVVTAYSATGGPVHLTTWHRSA